MSRYTGPKFRVSRRLGVSLSGTGKEIARRTTPLEITVPAVAQRFLITVCNWLKSKRYVSRTV